MNIWNFNKFSAHHNINHQQTHLEQDEDEKQLVDDSDTKPEPPISYNKREKVKVRAELQCHTGHQGSQTCLISSILCTQSDYLGAGSFCVW